MDQFAGEAKADQSQKSIEDTLEQFDIFWENFAAITTDEAANFSEAARTLSSHIYNIAHQLNLIVSDALS